ncbi:MAG TPA: hypothetical protein VFX61_05645 [Micromonosporaceae bacterium]|nr:hypothetical protein [Micromonosporaceae bacterium]
MPISTDRRTENYRKQSGRKVLTPRQRRRMDKKQNVMNSRGSSRR